MAILTLGNNNSSFSGSFSGSYVGDGSQLTNLPASSPFPFTGSALITGSLGVTGSISTDSNITINEGGYFRTFDTTTSQETLRVGQAGTTAGGELIISDNNGAAKIVLSITEGYINNGKDFGIGTNSPTSKLHVVSPTSSSLLVEGSGSTIFNIQGSQGQLFSVTDDLLDEVFSVSDISGDALLTVSGSGLVEIPVGDLSGSATATASYGAFKGDGSQLEGIVSASYAVTASHALNVPGGNTQVDTYMYSWQAETDSTFFNDGNISIKYDESNDDIDLVFLTEPSGNGDLVCCTRVFTDGSTPSVDWIDITTQGATYQLAGLIPASSQVELYIYHVNHPIDTSYPRYKVTVAQDSDSGLYNNNAIVKVYTIK